MIGFIDTYPFTQFVTTGNYSAICSSTNFQFTVAHALGSQSSLVVSWQRIYQSHWHFNSHMTSFWHSLIPSLPFPAAANSEDSTQFSSHYSSVFLQLLNSQFQFSNLISVATNRLSLYSLGRDPIENTVLTAPLPSNGYPIVARMFITGMFLSNRYLAVGRYVTIFYCAVRLPPQVGL
jgi:hypothetical protein